MGIRIKWLRLSIALFLIFLLPPLFGGYFVSILIFVAIYSIVGLGLALLIGRAGQISLGHNAFYGLGAYTSGILSFRYGISPWLGIICGALFTGSIAYLVGKPILRFRGHMLVIVTCAMGIIFWGLFGEMDFITGGYEGFSRIPRLSLIGFEFKDDITFFYLVACVFILLFGVASNICKSRIGSQFRSIDESRGGNEVAAETLGVNIGKIKTQVFVLSAIYASTGGSLYAHYVTHVDPGPFDLWTGFMFVIMVVLGGVKSLWGPVAGATFYVGLKEIISFMVPGGLSSVLAGYEILIFSLLFIVALIYSPGGLVELPNVIRNWLQKKGA